MSKTLTGKMSTFGGPKDLGIAKDENLALVDSDADFQKLKEYFLKVQPPGTTGYGRRLNTDTFYIACRWNYQETPRKFLQDILVRVTNPANGKSELAKPIDWGPNADTHRVADLSNSLADALGLDTNDICKVEIPLPGEDGIDGAGKSELKVPQMASSELIDKVIEVAKAEVGVREEGSSNTGTRVDQYERADTLGGIGYAWCGSFLAWCLKQVDPNIKYCYSPSCDEIAAWAKSSGVLHEKPQRGDIFLLFAPSSTTDATHTGLVVGVDGARFSTVEGNTNMDGSPTGIGVFSLKRTNGNRYRFVRWIDLNDDQPKPYTVFVGEQKLNASIIGAAAFVSVREWGEALGFDVEWNNEKQVPLFDGREVSVQIRKKDKKALARVRELAHFSGLILDVDGVKRTIRVKKMP